MSRPPHTYTGSYNTGRGVPPPRAVRAQHPERQRASTNTDPFLLRIVVLVDEATEPGISEADAERRRMQFVDIVLDRSFDSSLPAPTTSITGGQAVAFALRKRLKSDDQTAVLNTIALLDELMRTCPYFYRYVANEKFFRRMWRFVVPDYKNGVKSMIPLFGKTRVQPAYRGQTTDVAERVMILIRAWAEELSVMYNGRYDPDAGFLIERYNSKRSRIRFPEVPSTPIPWVCPISAPDTFRGTSSRGLPESMSLAEVENTANLFTNLIDNASSLSELKEDLCTELAARCKLISQNLTQLSMNMSKEEELARAIAVSEILHSSLDRYTNSLKNGVLERSTPPTVDNISVQSEDEGYDERPQEHYSDQERPSQPRYESSDSDNSLPVQRMERSTRGQREPERRRDFEEDHRNRDERDIRPARDSRDAYATRDLRADYPFRRYESSAPVEKKSTAGAEKRSRRAEKASLSRRQKSDSDLVGLVKEKKASKSTGLVELESDSEEEEVDAIGAAALLAERYSSKTRKTKSKPSRSSRPPKPSGKQEAFEPPAPAAPAATPPGAMYQSTTPGMPMNPMMVPNPYQMYGSVNSVPVQDPMGLFAAYQTVNPAMYYGSYNPQQLYPSLSTVPPSLMPPMSNQAAMPPGAPSQSSEASQQLGAQQMMPPQQVVPQIMIPPQQMMMQQRVVPSPQIQSPVMGAQTNSQALLPNVPQQQQPQVAANQNPLSFYNSMQGQNQIMASNNPPPVMLPPTPPQLPSQPTPQSQQLIPQEQASNGGAMTGLGANQSNETVRMQYQSAMQQAAVAYHNAATAYQSISGQSAIAAPGQMGSSPTVPPPVPQTGAEGSNAQGG